MGRFILYDTKFVSCNVVLLYASQWYGIIGEYLFVTYFALTGQRFALREGGRTVGAGVVSKVLSWDIPMPDLSRFHHMHSRVVGKIDPVAIYANAVLRT